MTEEVVMQWISQYGYLGIFFLLIFGIIGLPIPDEWLLVLSGYLVFKDTLSFFPTATVAVLGSISGLTMSYMFGRTSGSYIISRYGRWLSITDENVRRVQQWFQTMGRWTLIIGPFIPGIRNLMGFVAGASKLQLHVFARFAYLGALISSLSFVGFGYLLGRHINFNDYRPGFLAFALPVLFIVYTFFTYFKVRSRKTSRELQVRD